MAENSSIEWTDHTFNPWVGCTKVSPGCDHCYAEARMDTRLHRVSWGPGQPRQRTKTWGDPIRWNKAHDAFYALHGRLQRVFCASLADVFDNEVPEEWRHDLFNLIAATPNLEWLLLTKRPQNIVRMVNDSGCIAGNGARYLPGNVRLGATAENQARADINVPALLRAMGLTGAAGTFLSMEPLLGPVDLTDIQVRRRIGVEVFDALHYDGDPDEDVDLGTATVDWVIVGGESGHGARPMHPAWAKSLRDQCAAAGVPFLFKQWGEWMPVGQQGNGDGPGCSDFPDYAKAARCVLQLSGEVREAWPAGAMLMRRIGKKAAGRLLDGRLHDGFPGLTERPLL